MDLGTRAGLDPDGAAQAAEHPALVDPSEAARLFERIVANIGRVVQGNEEAIRLSVTCLVAGGHLLVEDVPGVGKTSLGKSLAASVSCRHRRIQFTSDLLPSDVTGVSVFDVTKTTFEFRPGPIFANIVLGDEINRTPPKTQSALLESMEERQVTVDGVTYKLPDPFMVVATQNPIEHEGTFPLPVSQLDRFLLRIQIGYPDAESEATMLETHGVFDPLEVLQAVATPEDVVALAARARGVHTSPLIQRYIVQIANATRSHPAVVLGMSPRAALALQRAARARAVLEGREFVAPDDVKAMAPSVISHRLELRASAGRGRNPVRAVLDEVLRQVPVPDLPAEHR
jgi:MoxR-like ATPase